MARPAKKPVTGRKIPAAKKIANSRKAIAKTASKNASDLRDNALSVADSCKDIWDDRQDLKAAQVALKGYSTANSIIKSQLGYKKLSGKPVSIPFLEK
jgi:hypothetical protein